MIGLRPLAACAFALLMPALALAETPAEGFAKAAGARTNPGKIEFTDDPTDVTGKAWEFTKALVGANELKNVEQAIDLFESGKTIVDEGPLSAAGATAAVKVLAKNFTFKRAEDLVKKLNESELFAAAQVLGIKVEDDLADSTKDIQRKLAEYLLETAPNVAATAGSEGKLPAGQQLFLDIMGKACAACDAAWKGYDLAAEANRAVRTAFENEATQVLFARVAASAGWRDKKEFQTGFFLENGVIMNEARRAVEAMWEAAGRTGKPSDEDVLGLVYDRFVQWEKDKSKKAALDAQIAKIEPFFVVLDPADKRWMYGEGTEESWADQYIADSLALWNRLAGMRGNGHWPAGGQDQVIADIALLVKLWRQNGMSEEQIDWELRKLAAGYGWMAKAALGPRPEPPRTQVTRNIAQRLPDLSPAKLKALFDNAGIVASADFLNCLCPGGFHYYDGPNAVLACRYIGPLGGETWAPFVGGAIEGCSAAHPMADGRKVLDVLADRLLEIRKAQPAKP